MALSPATTRTAARRRPRASRWVSQAVVPKITSPPIHVKIGSTSPNTRKPIAAIRSRFRNVTDWLAVASAAFSARVTH